MFCVGDRPVSDPMGSGSSGRRRPGLQEVYTLRGRRASSGVVACRQRCDPVSGCVGRAALHGFELYFGVLSIFPVNTGKSDGCRPASPHRVRTSCEPVRKDRRNSSSCGLVRVWPQVCVDPQCRRRGRVSKSHPHDLHVEPCRDEHARVVVAQVVDPESFGQALDCRSCSPESFFDRVRGDGPSERADDERVTPRSQE